jgi:hypothetical protein
VETETLARKLGTTTHLSLLLRKARRCGLSTPEDLERLAVQRGCRYYDSRGGLDRLAEEPAEYRATSFPAAAEFSNEELALALLSIVLPKSQWRLRLGAAMLAADGNSPERLARLAIQERAETVVSYIAECGRQVEPENPFWQELLSYLPKPAKPPAPDVLPHITRFVAMTGFTRQGKETIMQWVRPTRAAA